MKITFKLYATLTDYLPAAARSSNRVEIELPAEASIADVIAPYGLPMKLVHLVLVNGVSIFLPGASGSKCFDLDPGLLKVEASSPPGRSGESAFLDVGVEGQDPILHTLVADSFAPGASERPIQVQ